MQKAVDSRVYHLELINRIVLHDDKSAFEILFDLYHSKLVKVAAYFLGNYTYAEDVVSEVFIKFLAMGHKMQQIKDPPKYFFVATKNQALTYYKKNIFYQPTDDCVILKFTSTNINPEELIIQQEVQNIINNTKDKFPIKRKIIFEMIKEENLSYKEVANQLEVSVKAVEKQMNLAMQSLRLTLNEYFKKPKVNKPSNLNFYIFFFFIALTFFI